MVKKILLVMLCLIALTGMANAKYTTVMPTDVNLEGQLAKGGGFITTDVNVVFTLWDTNGTGTGNDYNLSIYYGTVKGSQTTAIVEDLNIGDNNSTAGYCTTMPSGEGATALPARCEYPITAAVVNAITDGNYWIDVNVAKFLAVGGVAALLSDQNMDTNYSFYVDNTPPECEVKKKSGNQFNWFAENEETVENQGSITTIYYSVGSINKDPVYSTSTLNPLEDHYTTGKLKYSCYATDTAGNTGVVASYTVEYPSAGGGVTISGGAVRAAQLQAIVPVSLQEATAFVQENPVFIGIALVAGYLLLSGGKKAKGKKGKR